MRSGASVVCLLVALFVPGLLGQQPTFRAGIELVEIDAVVTDGQGNPVIGLTADDFEVSEGGKPQVIAAFSEVNIPGVIRRLWLQGGTVARGRGAGIHVLRVEARANAGDRPTVSRDVQIRIR